MPDAAQNRMLALLTMSRRAGKLLLGFDAVKEAAERRQVVGVFLAQDCAARTEKEIRFHCPQLPVRKLPFLMDDLTPFFTKRTAVFGLCEQGFSEKLLQLLEELPA